jgi:AcrR family transcriptional regulator
MKAHSPAPAPAPSVRERILAAALRQVREGNLASVTARTICKEAQITAPTLYHYFGDLPGLYCAALERIFELVVEHHPDERDDPQAVIDFVWDRLLDSAERESGVINLLNQLLASGTIPDLMLVMYKRLEDAFEVLSRTRPLSVDPRLAAEIYWAAALGMSTLVAATRHGIPYPTGAAQVLRKTVLEGIAGPRS